MYAANQRIYQFVRRAQRQPFYEELIYLVLRKLESNIASELTIAQLIHFFFSFSLSFFCSFIGVLA